jgi:taurine dioxygenase
MEEAMAGIQIRDLDPNLSFGSIVDGVNWETLADEGIREQLRNLFRERGIIVFKNMEPTAKMQIALSKVFGPLKDHPTKSTPRDEETGDEAVGVIDMHYVPDSDLDAYAGGFVEVDGVKLTRFSQLRGCAALADRRARARPDRVHGRNRGLPEVSQGAA